MKKPESKYKKGDMVRVKNSTDQTPKRIVAVNWNKDYSEWLYRIVSNIAPFFANELIGA